MPIREFSCLDCKNRWDEVMRVNASPEEYDALRCPACASAQVQMEFALVGGYKITGDNGASVRPKQAGSFRSGK